MPLFRRNHRQPEEGAKPAAAARGGSAASRPNDHDWRSYDGVAEVYARVHAPRTALPAGDLVEVTQILPGGRVLDVGTGTGVVARAAHDAGAGLVVGVDPSIPMLRQARQGGDGPRFAAAAAIDLPFRAGTFDAVLAAFALSQFAKAETALFDMVRVLRQGGRLGVSAWGPGKDDFSTAWSEVAEEFAEHEMLADAYTRAQPGAERFSDGVRLKDTLHDAGLRDIRIDHREYRFQMTAEEYLVGKETASSGRFLQQMLGDEYWETFRRRTREVFAERFPPAFNDFRDVVLAAGHKA